MTRTSARCSRRCLDAGGHRVLTASNGREALSVLDRVASPCLVLLDLMMPVMSGFAFLEELHQRPERQRVNVLLISANAQVEQVRGNGVVGFVTKPFDWTTSWPWWTATHARGRASGLRP